MNAAQLLATLRNSLSICTVVALGAGVLAPILPRAASHEHLRSVDVARGDHRRRPGPVRTQSGNPRPARALSYEHRLTVGFSSRTFSE
jgi:hypothetical protein